MKSDNNINKTILNFRGYGLLKSEFDYKTLNNLRHELTVSPKRMSSFGGMGTNAPSYPIYQESEKRLYIPKHLGLQRFGIPDKNKLKEGLDINLKFNGKLRENQVKPVEAFLKAANDDTRYGGLINLECGGGKCHGINTPIIMYDGSIKKVQDIKVGDKLMGDDSTPRNVLSLARGREMMYDVIPKKGDKYTVNESHILSVRSSVNYSKKIKKGDIYDIPLVDFLNLPKPYHDSSGPLLGYRVGIDFPEKKIDLEPYFLGYWLGDGTSKNVGITTIEKCVIDYYTNYSNQFGLRIRKCDSNGTRCPTYYATNGKGKGTPKNKILNMLKKHKLINNKHIPEEYKYNSRAIRLELLAGIIDSDGSLSNNAYDIIQKNERLLDDIIYLARSLGFAAYKLKCEKSCIYKGEKKTGTYYRTNIHGDGIETIPVKCERKKASKRKQINNVLNTRISIEKKEVDNYYGFTLDGNHRYLLGDFQVTHNTALSLYIISKLKKKTLVIVHKDFLLKQWRERIEQFLPDARVGLIKAKVINIEGKDIVVGSLQSLAMKEYDKGTFDEFGLVICDEVHNFAAEVFSRALFKTNFKYSLGLSATMTRKDGLSKVFKWHLGDIVFKTRQKRVDEVNVICYEYFVEDKKYSKEELIFNGKLNMARMINNICEYEPRINKIVNIIKNIKKNEKNRNILLLSDRRNHLKEIKEKLDAKSIGNPGYYVGGMKDDELKKSEEECDILLGTFSMASEGMDIPKLDTIILSSPKSDIVQSVGRILRKKPEDRIYVPLIIDINDMFSMFINQSKKREKYYNKCKYNITKIKNEKIKNIQEDLNKLNKMCLIE
jgi:superfamily II DNA or RNA helicase